MTPQSDAEFLRRITRTLLDTTAELGTLRDATIELHALFSRICEMDINAPSAEDSRETLLTDGKAICPLDAGRCVLDFARTTKFIRGVKNAIMEAHSRFPGNTVHVLYAGCGPFAALVLPLATVLQSGEVQFTIVDKHERSLHCVSRIARALDLSSFVHRSVRCDATIYDHGQEPSIDVLVVETMQKALSKEPQVAISMNLVPQMRETGILVPERITLTAALADLGAEIAMRPAESDLPQVLDDWGGGRRRVVLGVPFELTAESVRKFAKMIFRDEHLDTLCLPARTIRVGKTPSDKQQLVILTTITVFESIVLGDYESGLTYPTIMPAPNHSVGPGDIAFVYQLGPNPGLTIRLPRS